MYAFPLSKIKLRNILFVKKSFLFYKYNTLLTCHATINLANENLKIECNSILNVDKKSILNQQLNILAI